MKYIKLNQLSTDFETHLTEPKEKLVAICIICGRISSRYYRYKSNGYDGHDVFRCERHSDSYSRINE